MASRRMTRESFDAIMQVKAKRYHLDRSDPIDEALHQLRVHARPAPRAQYEEEEEEEEFHGGGKYVQRDWREEPWDDYSRPSYSSSSHVAEEEDYFGKSCTQPSPRSRDYSQAPLRERDYGRSSSAERDFAEPPRQERDYVRPASRERDYRHLPSREPARRREADYESPDLLADFRAPGLLEEDYRAPRSQDYELEYSLEPKREFSPPLAIGRGRGLWGKERGLAHSKGDMAAPIKKWVAKGLSLADDSLVDPIDPPKPRPVLPHRPQLNLRPNLAIQRSNLPQSHLKPLGYAGEEEPNLDLVDSSDIFSTFGVEIIKWAGFHEIKRDPEYSELFRVLFTLETETCAKMLASFKCSLKPEHQDFCLSSVRFLQHAALRTPKVDSQFLNLLLEKRVVVTKNSFFEVIKPFDRYMMRIQDYLLRGCTPLLMACNAYELSIKSSSFSDRAQMAAAFETTVSLCRKSLALLGQTFALASAFRQEKILEALSVFETAPSPTLFPNFDTSALFGREYIETLRSWLDKSGTRMRLKRATAGPEARPKIVPEARPKIKIPQCTDPKVVETIEKLVNRMISGMLTGRQKWELKGNPEYWFLHEEDSLEYKYYKLKLSEMGRLMTEVKEEAKEEKTPEQRAADTVRTLLYYKKIASIKKKLFRGKRPGILQRAARAKRVKKCTVGTQTLLSAGMMLKEQPPGGSSTGPSSPDPEEVMSQGDVSGTQRLLGVPGNSQSLMAQFRDVDPKTMDTAQKLAEFVAEVGPEIEQFSIDNSADNPDLWFLQDQESAAFKFYRLKVRELCPAINFSGVPGGAEIGEGLGAAGAGWENMEYEAEMEEEEEAAGLTEEADDSLLEEGPASKEEGGGDEGQAMSEGAGPDASAQESACGSHFRRKRISSRSLKVGLIPASKRICLIDEPKVHDPVRIPYDRPSGYSTYKNKKKSKDLEFRNKRLNQNNIGFQMLQRMGWQEGLGLGLHGKGIKEPVKVGSTSAGEGLGVAREEKKEDTFATFRQRMIQMYYLKRDQIE
ncbi:SURP and G-patch domain-containing protein 2 isoform X2 [Elgaria multicarinata webbii]|uniref:SURP and G-patch domain-containing protein 2 isoform X2 n=1 Tax=Elgaria multicarinata webbii TaxID=159646 RepID=UPI002FCD2638